ncbi:MAG: hypothetical protein R6V04_15290, partial [bacterium]
NWSIPASYDTYSSYQIKITSTSNASLYDYSDNYFSLKQKDDDVSLVGIITCSTINNGVPEDIKSDFTSSDDWIFVYAEWMNGTGDETIFFKWYYPNGQLKSKSSTWTNPGYSYFHCYNGHSVNYEFKNNPGTYLVEVYCNGQLDGSINFNFTNSTAKTNYMKKTLHKKMLKGGNHKIFKIK